MERKTCKELSKTSAKIPYPVGKKINCPDWFGCLPITMNHDLAYVTLTITASKYAEGTVWSSVCTKPIKKHTEKI